MTVECHTVRFYQLEPKPIHCMKCEPNLKLLALSRQDSSIEVWNVRDTPHLERVILGSGGTVEGLAWFGNRLFSVGLQGSIIEYDLITQSPKSMHPLTSGASWCISVHAGNNQLVAGTEDGFINLFDITDNEIMYNKLMDKQEGKIVCIEWERKGEYLVSGSADTVRVWSVETGHAVHRLLTGRAATATPTIVWALTVTTDFTIISADSRGKLCFWDGQTGASISTYQSHKADILALALSEDENIVYCAGRDPLIASYEKVKVRDTDERGKWVKSIQRVIHDHEVKALATSDGKLFSAGLDSYLALSTYPPKTLVRYPPLLPGCSVSVDEGKGQVLLRYHDSVELWRLDSDQAGHSACKLVQWKSQDSSYISAIALAHNSTHVAISTVDKLSLLALNTTREIPIMERMKIKGGNKFELASNCISFSKNGTTLACAAISGNVFVITLSQDKDEPARVSHVHNNKKMTDAIHLLSVSEDAKFIVASDLKSNIIVWSGSEVYCKLPRYDCTPTALAIQPKTNNLVIVYSNLKIIEYCLSKKKFTKFSKGLEDRHPKQWLSRSFPVRNIMFDSRNPDIIALHDDSTILVINKNKELPDVEAKIPRLKSPEVEEESAVTVNTDPEGSNSHPPVSKLPKHAFHVIKKYKHLVYVGGLGEGKIVAVELSPVFIKEKLPPPVKRAKFGEM